MCGISGFLSNDSDAAQRAVERMNRAQRHRGPDDEGLQSLRIGEQHLALGHRRLAILDLTSAGHQPMQNPTAGDWIVYNGEIYNYPALRKELEAAGHSFASRCDTEAILKGFDQWGTGCFERLRGMFSLALYDAHKQRLVLARDPMGIKPLYYFSNGKTFAFASEVRALLATGHIPREINRRALASLLAYGAVQAPDTICKGVRALPPGTFAEIALAGSGYEPSIREFWHFPAPQPRDDREKAVAEVREHLEQSVQSHLLSDVPVAVFLSRGLDSTAIAALSASTSDQSVEAFTVTLEGHPAMDEGTAAARFAQHLGLRHHKVALTDAEARSQAQDFLNALDQPSVDGLNTYVVSKAVHDQGFKVALSGLGGDEIFGGYSTFRDIPRLLRWAPWAKAIPSGPRRFASAVLFAGKSPVQRLKAVELAETPFQCDHLYFRRRRLFSDREMTAFGLPAKDLGLNADYIPPECNQSQYLEPDAPESTVGNLESRFYMANMLLRDADVCGMAHGLEIRVPMLDLDLVNLVSKLPSAWRVRDGRSNKPLLIDAMKERMASDLANQPKLGFSLPIADWMAGPFRERLAGLLDGVKSSNLLDSRAADQAWQQFTARPHAGTWPRAWLLAVLGSWITENIETHE